MNPQSPVVHCSNAARWKWKVTHLLGSSFCHAAKSQAAFSSLIADFYLFMYLCMKGGRDDTGQGQEEWIEVSAGISEGTHWVFLGIWCSSFSNLVFLPHVLIKSWWWIVCTSSIAGLREYSVVGE